MSRYDCRFHFGELGIIHSSFCFFLEFLVVKVFLRMKFQKKASCKFENHDTYNAGNFKFARIAEISMFL